MGHMRPNTPVAHEKMMPQRRRRMYTGKCEECIGQVSMDVLRRSKHRPVGWDTEIKMKYAEIEYTAMPNECHHTHDRRDEHQGIERQVHRNR
jgi:hypothetical protein